METIMKADIFFFISSVATVVLSILTSVLLFYLIKTWKNLHTLSEKLKDGLEKSEEFVDEFKERLENNMVFRLFFPTKQRRRTASKDGSEKK